MSAVEFPDGVTTVIVSRGGGAKVVHRPRAESGDPEPACPYRQKDAVRWRRVALEAMQPFATPCRYCFDPDPELPLQAAEES